MAGAVSRRLLGPAGVVADAADAIRRLAEGDHLRAGAAGLKALGGAIVLATATGGPIGFGVGVAIAAAGYALDLVATARDESEYR